jgi:hypothetical protein
MSRCARWTCLAVFFAASGIAVAKEKSKPVLSQFILDARTVVVWIDPDAGIPVNDPLANRTAQSDVEKALLKWGRYRAAMDILTADIVIVVRKGSTQAITPTIGGVPTNDRPIIVQGAGDTVRVGVQQGRPPGDPQPDAQDTRPTMGGEVAPAEDFFAVYEGHLDHPTDRAPLWRCVRKDGLRSPSVPAVEEFRKAVEQALKDQQQKKQQKRTPGQGNTSP